MYSLLIVDDEEYICDSLFQLFSNQKELNLEVSKAYCAQEALELLNQQRFDIVMTDIEMPGMSGIELMKEISKRWINCKIVFLTAHSKFDYIYSTGQYKNTYYLLKTEKIEKIIGTIRDLTEELRRDSYNAEMLSRMKEEQQLQVERYLKYLIADVLQGIISGNQLQKQYMTSSLSGFRLEEPVYLFLGTTVSSEMQQTDCSIVKLHSIIHEVEQTLSTGCVCIGTVVERDYLVWLVQPDTSSLCVKPEEAQTLCFSLLNGNMPVIQEMIQAFLGSAVSIVISREPVAWDEVSEAYQNLKQMLFYHQGVLGGEILLCPEEAALGSNAELSLAEKSPVEHLKELEHLILDGNLGEIEHCFQNISHQLSTEGKSNTCYYEVYYSIALELISIINRYHLTDQIVQTYSLEKMMNYHLHLTWAAAMEYLLGVVSEILRLREYYRETSANKLVNAVNEYIHSHLNQELSLNKLADIMHYNPAYFSRIYKEITGENVKKYISKARIQKSKELLHDSNFKIAEISEMVGFDHPGSFGRFFKEFVGMTPQKYRDSL